MKKLNIIIPINSSAKWAGEYSLYYNECGNEVYLNDAIEYFLKNLQSSSAVNTFYCYSRDLNLLLEAVGNIKMYSIDVDVLNNFITELCFSGKKCIKRSNATINRIKSVYRSFFNYCYKRKFIKMNLANEISLVKSSSRFTPAITQGEIIALFSAISHSQDRFSLRDQTLFAVYAFTGLRKSEVLKLRISDYDRVSKLLYLPHVKRSSKNFQSIPYSLIKILDNYLQYYKPTDSTFPLFPTVRLNNRLFGTLTCMSGRHVSYRFEKWKVISGIRKNLTIHSFRVAYASKLYKKTKDPLLVSYSLGHSSFNTTKNYIRDDSFNFSSILDDIFSLGFEDP